jgi:hypothetical protein
MLESQFKGALFRFAEETEEKPDPRALMQEYQACQEKQALLMEAQAAYNLRVQVTVQNEAMTLQRAVKLIGSAGHVKNQWKTAAQENDYTQYYGNALRQRTKDAEYAERVVSVAECLQLAEEASRQATALKQAIRSGNATEVELEVDPRAFE